MVWGFSLAVVHMNLSWTTDSSLLSLEPSPGGGWAGLSFLHGKGRIFEFSDLNGMNLLRE